MKSWEKRKGLAIASVVLGGISSVCCMSMGIGIIPALTGTAFGVIAIVSGSEKARQIAAVGVVLGIIGLATNTVVIVRVCQTIDWSNLTLDSLFSALGIDLEEMNQSLQEFEQFLEKNS